MRYIYLAAATLATTLSHADSVAKKEKISQPSDQVYGPKITQGFFVTADFLYWIAHEEGLEYATRGLKTSPGAVGGSASEPVPPGSAHNVDFEWGPGFRIGAGYTLPKSFWDLGLTWTHYSTDAKGSASHAGDFRFNPLWAVLNHPLHTIDAGVLTSGSAKWHLHYNTLDLELSRYFFPHKYFSIKPHAGVRAAWINQKYDIRYMFGQAGAVTNVLTDVSIKNHNDYSGAGFKIGIDSLWHFNRYFGIFANGSFSLLGGNFEIKDKETTLSTTVALSTQPDLDFIDTHDNFFDLIPELEVALGFNFQVTPERERYRLEFNAGWEYLLWFDQNQIRNYTNAADGGKYIRQRGNLQLMGFTLNAKLHF